MLFCCGYPFLQLRRQRGQRALCGYNIYLRKGSLQCSQGCILSILYRVAYLAARNLKEGRLRVAIFDYVMLQRRARAGCFHWAVS